MKGLAVDLVVTGDKNAAIATAVDAVRLRPTCARRLAFWQSASGAALATPLLSRKKSADGHDER